MTVYIGNLPYQINAEDIESIFSKYGKVKNLSLPLDKESGRIRGFAFVELEEENDENRAIGELDCAELMGRQLRVSRARPTQQHPKGPTTVRRGFGGIVDNTASNKD